MTRAAATEGHGYLAPSRSSSATLLRGCVGRPTRWLLIRKIFAVTMAAPPAAAQAPPDPPPQHDEREAQAREHFRRGVVHFDREQWDAALAEFLRSRELVVTKANTKNAAICAQKVGRIVEAFELFQALLRDFEELPASDRLTAQLALQELSRSIGSIAIRDAPAGSTVTVDGVTVGTTPLPKPLRLPAGAHVVRVVREGLLPFEARVDLTGEEAVVLGAKLLPMTRMGLLRVTESRGGSFIVVVDGAPLGTTPWEGALSPGTHSVLLRGPQTWGTPPRTVVVELDRLAKLELVAAPLAAAVRIQTAPPAADVVIDGVAVGRGAWVGRLDAGAHRIDVSAPGYAPFVGRVLLERGQELPLSVVLEKSTPSAAPRARLGVEAELGAAIGLSWGGELVSGCGDGCNQSVPTGLVGGVRALYELPSRLGLGVHVGYLRVGTRLESRPERIAPVGRGVFHDGVATDELRLGGLVLDGVAQYSYGETWRISLALGAGALIGAVTDRRSGRFGEDAYAAAASQSPRAQFIYVAPDVRLERRLTTHVALGLAVRVVALAPIGSPAWTSTDTGVLTSSGDLGYFPSAALTGSLLVFATPLLSARFEY